MGTPLKVQECLTIFPCKKPSRVSSELLSYPSKPFGWVASSGRRKHGWRGWILQRSMGFSHNFVFKKCIYSAAGNMQLSLPTRVVLDLHASQIYLFVRLQQLWYTQEKVTISCWRRVKLCCAVYLDTPLPTLWVSARLFIRFCGA